MTREEARKILTMWMVSSRGADGQRGYIEGWFDKDDVEAFRMAIKALSADRPTGSDFISKAEVLETYSELYWFDIDCGVVSKAEVDKIYERLQSLPSADRPTGEWARSNLLPNGWHCSHCDAPVMTDDIDEMLFCPNCGAKMGVNK